MMRPELDAATMPMRMRKLPLDPRGYPVPWFVAWSEGTPEFRAMDGTKWRSAVRDRRCWVCGEPLGRWLTFVIGPMCAINRTTAEPPCHTECARWSAINCPFLSRPHMVRREDDIINADTHDQSPGCPILRNPGVTLLWTTTRYRVFNDGKNKPLIELGPLAQLEWIAEGRPATRGEVAHSIETGLPFLRAAADKEAKPNRKNEALLEIARRVREVEALYPSPA